MKTIKLIEMRPGRFLVWDTDVWYDGVESMPPWMGGAVVLLKMGAGEKYKYSIEGVGDAKFLFSSSEGRHGGVFTLVVPEGEE